MAIRLMLSDDQFKYTFKMYGELTDSVLRECYCIPIKEIICPISRISKNLYIVKITLQDKFNSIFQCTSSLIIRHYDIEDLINILSINNITKGVSYNTVYNMSERIERNFTTLNYSNQTQNMYIPIRLTTNDMLITENTTNGRHYTTEEIRTSMENILTAIRNGL